MPSPQTKWERSVDRAMQSCTRVFGENRDADGRPQVLYLHLGETLPYRIDGIFEATTERIDLETGATVLSNEPRISVALSALQSTPKVGDTLTIRDIAYRVIEPTFDGQGTATLRLHVNGQVSGGGD